MAVQETVAFPIPATTVGLFGAIGAVLGTTLRVLELHSLASVT
jgi:hypothetical protein